MPSIMCHKNSALIAAPKPSEKANPATHHLEESMLRFRSPRAITFHPTKAIAGLTGWQSRRRANAYLAHRDQSVFSAEWDAASGPLRLPTQPVPPAGLYFQTTDQFRVPASGYNKFRRYNKFGDTPQLYVSDGEQMLPVDKYGWVALGDYNARQINLPRFALFNLYRAFRRHYVAIQAGVGTLLIALGYRYILDAWQQLYSLAMSGGRILHVITPRQLLILWLVVAITLGSIQGRSLIDQFEDRAKDVSGRMQALRVIALVTGNILFLFMLAVGILLLQREHPWSELLSWISSLLAHMRNNVA